MAVEKLEINEPVEGEQMTLEEQLEKQEAAKAAQSEQEVINENIEPEAAEEPNQQEEEETPEWLPKKFKTPEELAKAYSELEREKGKQSQPEETEEQEKNDVSPVSNAIQEASDSFYEKGELSEDNYKALEDNGIPREFVEAYVRGQEASIEADANAIRESVGGAENYDAMVQWANSSLSSNEINSFDEIVSSGSKDAATMAVKGLYARYMSEGGGTDVNIAKGGTSRSAIQPFNSVAQVTDAMKDPRYEKDPAYRAEVERRISVSNSI